MEIKKIIRAGNTEIVLCFMRYLDSIGVEYDPFKKREFINHAYVSSGYFDQLVKGNPFEIPSPLEHFLDRWKKSLMRSELIVLKDSVYNIRKICAGEENNFYNHLGLSGIQDNHNFGFKDLCILTQGARIMVVSSFADLMKIQHESESLKRIRPHFKPSGVIFYKFPYLFGNKQYDNSLEAVEQLYEDLEVKSHGLDAVVMSCGCYGAVLADKFFGRGLNAYYVGGDLQIFFGIMGNRWRSSIESQDDFQKQKEHWILKIANELVPPEANQIEGACYW